jgi:ABC-type uncharacterized transport system auxiliary subunit
VIASIGRRRIALALCMSAALAGCGGLFHSDARPEQVYILRAAPISGDPPGGDSLAGRSVTAALLATAADSCRIGGVLPIIWYPY